MKKNIREHFKSLYCIKSSLTLFAEQSIAQSIINYSFTAVRGSLTAFSGGYVPAGSVEYTKGSGTSIDLVLMQLI